MFIMIIGLALVVPNVSTGIDSTNMKSAARDLVSALRYARGQALISQQQTLLTIDLDNNTYLISSRDKIYTVPEAIEIALVTAQTEQLGEGQGSIRFFPDGSSTGGKITLAVADNQWQVYINWLTGDIQMSHE